MTKRNVAWLLVGLAAVAYSQDQAAQQPPIQVEISARVPTKSSSTAALELGLRFSADVAGKVTALRHWRIVGDPGPHTGRLWDVATGKMLTSVNFASETASGWQEQALPTAVDIVPGHSYEVSVSSVKGAGFPVFTGGFATGFTSGHLAAPPNAGVYNTTPGLYPGSLGANDYFRDVRFEPSTPAAQLLMDFPQDGESVPTSGGALIRGQVANLQPGDYTVKVTMTDAQGRAASFTSKLTAEVYPIQAGDAKREWAYTSIDVSGRESPPSQRASTPAVIAGGPFYAVISDILPGPVGTVARNLYQTKAGGSDLLLLATLNDNTTQTYAAHKLDSELGPMVGLAKSSSVVQPTVTTGPVKSQLGLSVGGAGAVGVASAQKAAKGPK